TGNGLSVTGDLSCRPLHPLQLESHASFLRPSLYFLLHSAWYVCKTLYHGDVSWAGGGTVDLT
ncbi:hypothetical protein CSUI_005455, partial [Cystoisospora suis]